MIPIKRRIILFSFLACLATGCSDDNERSQDASCSIGQVLSPDENVCMCDADNHWVNSGNTCKCAGGYALNATKDTCEPIICSVRGQIYSDLIGNCICDSSNHWVAEESWCKCAKGDTLNARGISSIQRRMAVCKSPVPSSGKNTTTRPNRASAMAASTGSKTAACASAMRTITG